MIKIKKSEFGTFIKNLQKNYSVFAHVTDGKATAFKKIKSADDINNKVLNTKRSPKEIFFPQSEVLFKYTEKGMEVPKREEKPFAIWGMRNKICIKIHIGKKNTTIALFSILPAINRFPPVSATGSMVVLSMKQVPIFL